MRVLLFTVVQKWCQVFVYIILHGKWIVQHRMMTGSWSLSIYIELVRGHSHLFLIDIKRLFDRSCCPEPKAVELLSQKDYLWPIKRHIKFKLDQIDLPKDIKLFHGQSLEAVEDILKAHCDKIGTEFLTVAPFLDEILSSEISINNYRNNNVVPWIVKLGNKSIKNVANDVKNQDATVKWIF